MAELENLIGREFGRLTVIERHPENSKAGAARWVCRCVCGKQSITASFHLNSGHTTSCGCFRREQTKKANRTHGYSKNAHHINWTAMKQRCYNPNHKDFHYYGGRGIKICDRWRNDFAAFISDMGERPSNKHSIDRIDVNGDYCPENCRWATIQEQRLNTRRRAAILQKEATNVSGR